VLLSVKKSYVSDIVFKDMVIAHFPAFRLRQPFHSGKLMQSLLLRAERSNDASRKLQALTHASANLDLESQHVFRKRLRDGNAAIL
jgi:hypothetical protein